MVALDWSKSARRGRADAARRSAIDAALFAEEAEGVEPSIPKADLRAEAAALTAGAKVTVLPTVRRLHCRVCGHQGTVQHPPGRAPRFRCKRCGSTI